MLTQSLVTHCAPTLARLKPGSMFSFGCTDGARFAREMRALNLQLRPKGVEMTVLRKRGDALLVYLYRPDSLRAIFESEAVREFLRRSFGEQAVGQGNEILLRLFEMQKQRGMDSFRQNIVQSCQEIRVNTDEGVRLQLLYYLVGVAKADNVVTSEEVNALQELAYHLGIDPSEVVSMLNLDGGYSGGGQTATENDKLAEAYKVLGVDPSATNDEVKAAYRKMALKHHPDRVAALGEDVRKSAERKFQEINDAKERVYASRGMN